jgi:CheY-like chemotaxis protein
MPEVDGYQFMQRLQELWAEQGGAVPSIALTAYTRQEDKSKALAMGFTAHIGKPVDPCDLLAIIAKLAEPAQQEAQP